MIHFFYSRSIDGSIAYHLDNEFGDDSRKLAPRVLNYVGRDRYWTEQFFYSKRISCLYEIVRSWQMPDLYEH